MKKLATITLALLCTSISLLGSPEATFQKAEELEKSGKVDEAIPLYYQAAEQGFAPAQVKMGEIYYEGVLRTKDLPQAIRWFTLAAEQNNPEAQLQLGCCYLNGEGVEANKREAVNLWLKAAKQGNSLAQILVGIAYNNGIGVSSNSTEASEWFNKVAVSEDTTAKVLLSLLYESGIYVEKDSRKAQRLLYDAAQKGDPEAQLLLGIMSFTKRKAFDAYKWIEQSAKQNYLIAQLALHALYMGENENAEDEEQFENHAYDIAKLIIKTVAKNNTSAKKTTVLLQLLKGTQEGKQTLTKIKEAMH